MNLAGLSLVLRRGDDLGDVLRRSATQDPVADPVGLLRVWDGPAVPSPWRALTLSQDVPDGTVEAARRFVLGFDVLRHVGIGVLADTTSAAPGTTVVQRMPRRGPAALAPCRVVDVMDTADEVGFAYAALPGHPFAGEEAFHVRARVGGGVVCRIASVSRPVAGPARLARPVTDRIQSHIAGRYLDGIVAAARMAREPSTPDR